MLRGAIDLIHPDRIGGWVYSESGSVRGRAVLAFLDGACIGSGSIEGFREDLADAGLGDGYLGFNFNITLPKGGDSGRAVVRLDGSDFLLVQPAAKIASATADSFKPLVYGLDNIEWMRSSGWLAPADFTLLKYLQQVGAYDHSLRQPKPAGQDADLIDPKIAAQPIFDLLLLRRAVVVSVTAPASEGETLINSILASTTRPLPIVAITSPDRGAISVLEGSHFDARLSKPLDGAVEYPYGPDRLLFLNLNCTFAVKPGSPLTSLTVLAAE
jgi:hypothetical protein